jgi:hypothetical protein
VPQAAPGLFRSALISGAIFGFLGGVPFLNVLNCACCSLILASGFVAALLYSRDCRTAGVGFDAEAGVKVGLVTGLVYAVADATTSTLVGLLFQGMALSWAEIILENTQDVPPEIRDLITGGGLEMGLLPAALLNLLVSLGFGTVFATIGGLIGGAVFKSEPPPPAAQGPGPGYQV